MTEASRGRFTVTLGRGGQVVERGGPASDGELSNSFPKPGSKRSVRDRLGSSNSDSSQFRGSEGYSKRQRGDSGVRSLGVDDYPISRDDLRFKLMRKNASKQAQIGNRKEMDLRAKLSRTVQQPPSNRTDNRPRMPDPRDASFLSRIPPRKMEDNLPQLGLSRNSYSPWSLDHIRRRSPDRTVGTYRGLSPPRSIDELQRQPLSRGYGGSVMAPYPRKDVFDAPRPVNAAPFATMSSLPPPSSKPLPPPLPPPSSMLSSQLPPLGSSVQKSPCTVTEHQTVDGLLNFLGLGKYVILFKAEEVDMPALKQMGENDLKELGIPMGPRKKILQALMPRSKKQP